MERMTISETATGLQELITDTETIILECGDSDNMFARDKMILEAALGWLREFSGLNEAKGRRIAELTAELEALKKHKKIYVFSAGDCAYCPTCKKLLALKNDRCKQCNQLSEWVI